MTMNGATEPGFEIPWIVGAEPQNRAHHDRDKEHRDIRLDVAEANGIAVAGDQIGAAGRCGPGHQRPLTTEAAERA